MQNYYNNSKIKQIHENSNCYKQIEQCKLNFRFVNRL